MWVLVASIPPRLSIEEIEKLPISQFYPERGLTVYKLLSESLVS